mgnify:FL=1
MKEINIYFSKENNAQTLELNIIVHLPNEHWPAFSDMFYWALYPKLPNKKISINI